MFMFLTPSIAHRIVFDLRVFKAPLQRRCDSCRRGIPEEIRKSSNYERKRVAPQLGSYCELLVELISWPDKPDANNVEHNFSGRPNQRRILMNLMRLALSLLGIRSTASICEREKDY